MIKLITQLIEIIYGSIVGLVAISNEILIVGLVVLVPGWICKELLLFLLITLM